MDYAYKQRSTIPFFDTIEAVERSVGSHGFVVYHKYDIGGAVVAKGFSIRPLVILEVGPAEEPAEAPLSLVFPCRINIYEEGGSTVVAALRPSVFCAVFPEHQLDEIVEDIEKIVIGIVDSSVA